MSKITEFFMVTEHVNHEVNHYGHIANKLLKQSGNCKSIYRENAKILLVDEQVFLRESLAMFLSEKFKLNIAGQANSTQKALHMLESCMPDIILCNIMMTGISSFELCKRAKIINPKSKLIFLIQVVSDQILERALKSGALGFVSKNSDENVLLKAIDFALQGKKVFFS